MQNDMREQIKDYLEKIFVQAPCTQKAIEMKEAILADVLDKYDDMISDGISPQDAYTRAVGSIGDLHKLIAELRSEQPGFTPPSSAKTPKTTAEQSTRRSVYKSIKNALWALILVFYFLISFGTGAWYITWVIFLIGGALEHILRAIFDLLGGF